MIEGLPLGIGERVFEVGRGREHVRSIGFEKEAIRRHRPESLPHLVFPRVKEVAGK